MSEAIKADFDSKAVQTPETGAVCYVATVLERFVTLTGIPTLKPCNLGRRLAGFPGFGS
jgi:hypothetical protein